MRPGWRLDGRRISDYLQKRKDIRAIKVNANIKCTGGKFQWASLTVMLWQRGCYGWCGYIDASTTVFADSDGTTLTNEGTWSECVNKDKTTYFGTADGVELVGSELYFQEGEHSPKDFTDDCGTS